MVLHLSEDPGQGADQFRGGREVSVVSAGLARGLPEALRGGEHRGPRGPCGRVVRVCCQRRSVGLNSGEYGGSWCTSSQWRLERNHFHTSPSLWYEALS